MPNRIIKESICESEGLSDCSLFACDLYKRLITYADDYGRFNSDTKIMRARLYPREYEEVSEDDLIDALSQLAGVGKLFFYRTKRFNQGKDSMGVYGVFPNWSNHQRIRESKAKCPEPDNTDVNDWYLRRFIPLDLKTEIIERDGFKCKICGKFLTSCREAKRFAKLGQGLFHIDHIVPVLQGGRATVENLRLTCPECNLKRKKRFTFKEILKFEEFNVFAESCGELPQNPAIIQSNPIQSQSESESEDARQRAEADFNLFWNAYPRKVGKQKAQKAFQRIKVPVDTLLVAIAQQKQSAQWKKNDGEFIPHPTTWLNEGRWEDELAKSSEIPKGASGVLGSAEIDAIRMLMEEGQGESSRN